MPALIVGNSRTEEMAGELAALTALERQVGGCSALRSLWFARSGDVLVLPYPPRDSYLAYVAGLTGTDPESLAVLIPPAGVLGVDLLTPDRTADAGFRDRLRAVVRERGVDQVMAVYKDVPMAQLAEALELRLPGHPFSAQGGDAFINSKAAFRAVAAGVGVPIAQGLATTRRDEAQGMANHLLAAGHSVIVKQEFRGGGIGNEILSSRPGVRVAGAPRAVVLPDCSAVADYFGQRWNWLTVNGRHRLVVERYLADCDTVYAEFFLADEGPRLSGVGELLMEPVAVGQVIPAQVLVPATRASLVAAGLRMARAVHAIGYRGYLSTDAVLTPSGEIFITETNGRISGSTHLHIAIEDRVLDAAHRGQRVLLERYGWAVPSFTGAVDRLTDAGLGFDQSTGTGVLLTSVLMPDGSVTYCVIAENLESVRAIEHELTGLFAGTESIASGER